MYKRQIFDSQALEGELTRLNQSKPPFPLSDLHSLSEFLYEAARLARSLPDTPERLFHERVKKEIRDITSRGGTEVERLVKQRVGQDVFRQSLMDYWNGACAVTGLALPEMLRANHIIPWAEYTSDADRLNVCNGLLLSANLDALFDRHVISVSSAGEIVFSPILEEHSNQLSQQGITQDLKLRLIPQESLPFLSQHLQRTLS